MKTYKETNLNNALFDILKQLNKKFGQKINFIKAAWQDVAPTWALMATPHTIKNNTLIFFAKNDALILKYREKELLNIAKLIIPDISSIKILYK